MNPLQQRAAILRERYKKTKEEEVQVHKKRQGTVGEQVVNLFSMDFPELYKLLVASAVGMEGDISLHGKKLILTQADKQVSIPYEPSTAGRGKWYFRGKEYAEGNVESEQRLIIELADAFAQAQTKIRS